MLPNYVLITPARNEAEFIELTIKSVIAQTVRPLKWVIVSDGSTDRTDEIVKKYAAEHSWIEFVRMPERSSRHFAGKVHAFNAGYERVRGLNYTVIGCLDADISFDEHYFSYLLSQFTDPRLGVAGTPFRENSNETYDYRYVNIEHVSGACQLFRRQCFEDVGGYQPVELGGVDYVIVITARMKGWKTRTFTGKTCEHHRPIGTEGHGPLTAKFMVGRKDYIFGNSPVWEIFRTVYQMTRPPLVLGGALLASGYLWAALRRMKKPVSREMVYFIRREQMKRLTRLLARNRTIISNTSPETSS